MTEITEGSKKKDKPSVGQRAADAVARFAGSWAFIFSFIGVMVVWMVVNVVLASNAFDAYPFILLNLVLSCIAAIPGSSYNDESESPGGKGQGARRKQIIASI